MKKTFVLDTNVLIHDPECVYKFEDNDIVIPISVIEELDSLKKGNSEINYSARQALRIIEAIRNSHDISPSFGIPIADDLGNLQIVTDEHLALAKDSPDNRIISVAYHLNQKSLTVLVSKDTAVRIKASALGIRTEDYKHDKTTLFQKYGSLLSEDHSNGILSVRYIKNGDSIDRLWGLDNRVTVKLRQVAGNISPKNEEQLAAIDALTSPDISVVALTGKAGSGKTLLALASAIHQTTKTSPLYDQILVARPVVPLGNDIGYLPGDIHDKIAPYMQPIFDNLEVIFSNVPNSVTKDGKTVKYKGYQYLIDTGLLQVEPLTYIRGRSLPKRYFIVDEAQNLRPTDIKTIVTRCGEGTKIVFTGDLDQIDSPFLDSSSNGLAYLISRFINLETFCYLKLSSSVRSELAEAGARLLSS